MESGKTSPARGHGCRLLGAILLCLIVSCGSSDRTDPNQGAELRASEVESAEIEALRALGYARSATGADVGAGTGVLFHDSRRAFAGLNYLTNAAACTAQLVGMDGKVHRSWRHEPCHDWGNTLLTPKGEVIAVHQYPLTDGTSDDTAATRRLLKFGWEGELLWEKEIVAHHDVGLTADGKIVTLTRRMRLIRNIHPTVPVRDHFIAVLSPEGDLLESESITEMMLRSTDVHQIQMHPPQVTQGTLQIGLVHSNAVDWMRSPELAERHPLYALSNVLITMRAQDSVAIVDWRTKEIIWSWGQGELSGPHDGVMLESGNILVFDNGLSGQRSRVIELDPIARRIVWQYQGDDDEPFFSPSRGSGQRLPNGNTLITVSDSAHAFEVTPSGEVVWSYRNPVTTQAGEPVVIVRTRRYPASEVAPPQQFID